MTSPQIHIFCNVNDRNDERVMTLDGADILYVRTIQQQHCDERVSRTWRTYPHSYEAEAAFREQAAYWLSQAGRHLFVAVAGL